MRIEVVGADMISQQARTYAEYRVFAALTQFLNAEKVRRACVLLRPLDRGRRCDRIACTVTVSLEGADSIRIRATGPHAYAAINRAVERIRTTAATGLAVDPISSEVLPETRHALRRALCVDGVADVVIETEHAVWTLMLCGRICGTSKPNRPTVILRRSSSMPRLGRRF